MRRRTLVATAVTAIATPLLAGCARDGGGDGEGDDGEDEGDRGAGGMYGMIGPGGSLAAEDPTGESGTAPGTTRSDGPALGPEKHGPENAADGE